MANKGYLTYLFSVDMDFLAPIVLVPKGIYRAGIVYFDTAELCKNWPNDHIPLWPTFTMGAFGQIRLDATPMGGSSADSSDNYAPSRTTADNETA